MQRRHRSVRKRLLLGWSQASWVSAEDWATRMHPDDREKVVEFCISQSQNGVDHEADYRALTAAGDYVWIRDVVHVVRDDNCEVDALIGFMFDISERKKTEEQLLTLQKQLEEYSYKDGLTGVANRRMFDSVLATEWANAQRTQQPLPLILLDIDHFKQFNDHYGHIQGDDCLKSVGQALSRAASRPRDFVGRFGGEEFVLLIPATPLAGGVQLLETLRAAIEACPFHFKGEPVTITLSAGIAEFRDGETPEAAFERADQALYRAKGAGRNRIEQA